MCQSFGHCENFISSQPASIDTYVRSDQIHMSVCSSHVVPNQVARFCAPLMLAIPTRKLLAMSQDSAREKNRTGNIDKI